jgi:hypothetical protein
MSAHNTPNQAMESLKKLVSGCKTQKDAAHKLGITPQYLCDILYGRRDISESVATSLGFERKVIFKKART